MSANPPDTGEQTRVIFTGAQPNPVLTFLRRPRIMLLMLAGFSILTVIVQLFTTNSIFFDNHNHEIDGALAGFGLGWEGIPLAAAYIYCIRDPLRHHAVFLMALLHTGSMAASQVYHLGTGDFSFESVAVPLAVSGGLALLVFLHIFTPKEPPTQPAAQPST